MEKINFKDIVKLPNLLSVFRFMLIPIYMYGLLSGAMSNELVFWIIILSWFSDILDGYIARKFNMITELGKLLDPLADKLTQSTILLCLWLTGFIPSFIFIALAIKDIILGIGSIYVKKGIKSGMIQANIWGKSATGVFYVAVLLSLLSFDCAIYFVYLAAVLMLIAFISYVNIANKLRLENRQNEMNR